MAALILEQWRTVSAVLFAAALVGSVVLSHSDGPRAVQASSEKELLKVITQQDGDGDGLLDWEETLYGADPRRTDSFGLGMTDKDAVTKGLVIPKAITSVEIDAPSDAASVSVDGLTQSFIRDLYARYRITYDAQEGDLTAEDIEHLVQESISSFVAGVRPAQNFKKREDLRIEGTGADALRAYAIAVEAILRNNTNSASESELTYLERAMKEGDNDALVKIAEIAKTYRASAVGIAVIPVPNELAGEALRLINSLARIGEISADFAGVRNDPLSALLALAQYPESVLALANTYIDIHALYQAAGITLEASAPGGTFVNTMPMFSSAQATRGN